MKPLILDYHAAWKEVKDFLMIALGCALYTLGVVIFMLPYQLATGGVSGVALTIFYLTGIEVELTYALINVFFLLIAVKVLGWKFCLKTIYGVAMCTVTLWFWQRILPDANGNLPMLVGDQSFMACILGAILEGSGLFICFTNHGSTGGTDIVAACINKYWDVSLGQMLMLCDVFIILSNYPVFHDWQRVIFGFVFLFVASMTLDYEIRKNNQSVEFKIFSRNYAGIAEAVAKAGYGVTILDGTGWWTKTERKVLISIVRNGQTQNLMRIIKTVDPWAFVSVTNVQSVYGEGFDIIKTRIKGAKPILVYVNGDSERFMELKQIIGKEFDLRTLEEVGCNSDDLHYIKQYYGHDAFYEEDGQISAVHGDPYGQFQTKVFCGDDALQLMIDFLKTKRN